MPIFDQGYQHWQGELAGHTWRWWAITREGVRRQVRGWVVRLVLILAWLPAIALGGALALWGLIEQQADFIQPILQFIALPVELTSNAGEYRVAAWTLAYNTFFAFEIFFSMLLVVLIGPGLISKDLRFNALPLYLSRPVSRMDYFLGKFGVIAVCLGMVTVLPTILAWLLGILFSLDVGVITDTFPVFLRALVFSMVIVVSSGLLMLGLSSLTRNSRYVTAMWLGVWFVGGLVSANLSEVRQNVAAQEEQREMFRAMREHRKAMREGTSQEKREARQALVEYQQKLDEKLAESYREDWTPLISFTGNLDQLKGAILNRDAAWDRIATVSFSGSPDESGAEESLFITEMKGSQFPWYWSALILAGLAGISALILNVRVRSLDRLK